jgi:hypothetical protein
MRSRATATPLGTAEVTQTLLGVDAAAGALGRRPRRRALVGERAGAVAVDAAGRAVDEPAQARRPRQRGGEVTRARIAGARRRRRREMQDGVGETGEAGERRRLVEVAAQRQRTRRAQLATRAALDVSASTRQRPASRRTTRRPMSPQPTISSTGLLKRVGRSVTAAASRPGASGAFGAARRQAGKIAGRV